MKTSKPRRKGCPDGALFHGELSISPCAVSANGSCPEATGEGGRAPDLKLEAQNMRELARSQSKSPTLLNDSSRGAQALLKQF